MIVALSESINPGAKYPSTKGEVWPRPLHELKTQDYYSFNPGRFKFRVTSHNCTILTDALDRYIYYTTGFHGILDEKDKPEPHHGETYKGFIEELAVTLTEPCEEYPHLDMDESYTLAIQQKSQLTSGSIWGILRGLESFSHLFYFSDDYKEVWINTTQIEDSPKYSHRGLLIDTSRHYISINNILLTLDAMSYNKLNVLHWHIVDDQSFPYESTKFPELSAKGAYHSRAVYTKNDIEIIIYHARDRGIRVIPEFDMPGHTRSWGEAYPELLTECYLNGEIVDLGPMNPTKNVTFRLLEDLFEEVNKLFPDEYFHIGGDEVDINCWITNAKVVHFMMRNNISDLQAYFMSKIISLLNPRMKTIVWQEVFDRRVPLSKDTLIQVWKSYPYKEMMDILEKGNKVLFSSMWYLDQRNTLGTWEELYQSDPRDMINNATINSNIVGGEACMWGEMVSDSNIISRVWPRASAVAERLWSDTASPLFNVRSRIEEHTCRLLQRGIKAQPPNAPSYCLH